MPSVTVLSSNSYLNLQSCLPKRNLERNHAFALLHNRARNTTSDYAAFELSCSTISCAVTFIIGNVGCKLLSQK